jgi:hypothetical protein
VHRLHTRAVRIVNGISASQARTLNRDEKQIACIGEAVGRRDRMESSFEQRQGQYKNTKYANDTVDIVRVKPRVIALGFTCCNG